jgi:hypothetical protein
VVKEQAMSEQADIEIDINAPEPEKKPDQVVETPVLAKGDDVVVVNADDGKKQEVTADDGIDALKKKLEESEKKASEADARAREADARAQHAQTSEGRTRVDLVNAAIDKTKGDNVLLKQQYAEALSTADYAKAADIQEALAKNAAALTNLEIGRSRLETEAAAAQPRFQPTGNPVEDFISAVNLSPPSAAWLRAHPQFASGTENKRMVSAHNIAVDEGIRLDSDEYFQRVEEVLRIKKAEPPRQQEEQQQPARQVQPAAAPVSRNVGTSGQQMSNRVTLSAQEREMAEMMGMTPKEYAINKKALMDEGKLGTRH